MIGEVVRRSKNSSYHINLSLISDKGNTVLWRRYFVKSGANSK